jgi:hypothetical protein
VEAPASSESSIQTSADIEPTREATAAHDATAAEPKTDSGDVSEAKWIAEERNAFDWQSAAGLAVRQNEERRADDEWATTNWDRGTPSEAEQVATLLNQVVRRVRAGELKVDATRGMSAESALAATLAALLRSED